MLSVYYSLFSSLLWVSLRLFALRTVTFSHSKGNAIISVSESESWNMLPIFIIEDWLGRYALEPNEVLFMIRLVLRTRSLNSSALLVSSSKSVSATTNVSSC